jgi:hypothetical protein
MSDVELDRFLSDVNEMKAVVSFIRLSTSLRAFLPGFVSWDIDESNKKLLSAFLSAQTPPDPTSLLNSFYLLSIASFEGFLVEALCKAIAVYEKGKTNGQINTPLKRKSYVLSGRLLARLENPPEHIAFDVTGTCRSLAALSDNEAPAEMNKTAFAISINPLEMEAYLELISQFGVRITFDSLATNKTIQKVLSTSGTRPTAKAMQVFLEEVRRSRNRLAHSGNPPSAISAPVLEDMLVFLESLAIEIWKSIKQRHNKSSQLSAYARP